MKIKIKIGFFALAFVFFANCVSPVFAAESSDSSLGPTAAFTADPTAAVVGNSVSFDASASRDARGSTNLDYRWDFDNYDWTSWSSSKKTTHAFTESGSTLVRLQVRDDDGLVDETAITISVGQKLASSAPFAQFFVAPTMGDTSTDFIFTVELVSNIHSLESQLELRWDWEGDGQWDTDYSKSREFHHTFTSTGYKEVWLGVCDLDGSTTLEKGFYVVGEENDSVRNKVVGRILIAGEDTPRASFTNWPAAIEADTLVHFDASDSIRASEFRWDFAGDGRFDNAWNSDFAPTHTFRESGNFEVILEVRNSAGVVDRTTRTIAVADEEGNIPPVAKFTVRNRTNSGLDLNLGILLDEFYFSASGSSDTDGSNSKMKVRWDFDGDGIWDTTFSTAKTATHRFTATGEMNPMLEVLDELGASAKVSAKIQIVANTAPRIQFAVTPTSGTSTTNFKFSATGTEDDQTGTSGLEYRFDFDGDGVFDTEFTSSKTKYFKLAKFGNFSAVVEVRDSANATSRASADFRVSEIGAPIAAFVATPRVGTFATQFEFDASLSRSSGEVDDKLKYRWDFDYQGDGDLNFDTGWTSSIKKTRKFKIIGDHSIRLLVKNSVGDQSDFFTKIKIDDNSKYFKFLENERIISSDDVIPNSILPRVELAKMLAKATNISTRSPLFQQFTDVERSSQNARYISAVVERGWLPARQNFAWEPNSAVTRAEATRAIISALYPKVANSTRQIWLDISTSSELARFAEAVFDEKLFVGSDQLFYPNQKLTKSEGVRMIGALIAKYPRTTKTFSSQNIFASFVRLSESF